MNKKFKKIILVILILLILSGIIILCTIGFKKSTMYAAGTRIETYIPKGYNKQDIYDIAKDSFVNKKFSIEEVEKLNQVVVIKLQNYTQDEFNKFKTSIAEKYNIDVDKLEIYEISQPTIRISTEVMPYVLPVLLLTIFSLIYILFRNIKSENKWNILLKMIGILAIIQGVYFSLILIFRIPFEIYTMPLSLAIYIITLITYVNYINKNTVTATK